LRPTLFYSFFAQLGAESGFLFTNFHRV
jgi:hypothetical protein